MSALPPADPHLPPLYRLAAVDGGSDAFEQALALAAGTAEDGTVAWSRRADRLDCAIVFRPEAPLSDVLPVVYAVALGLGDAIGALAPPIVALHFRWPDRFEVNGAFAGGLRAGWSAGVAADAATWLVIGICVAIASPEVEASPAEIETTTLYDEGCADITSVGLLESFSRHALAWINRWQDDGFAPVREAWLSRATGLREEGGLAIGGDRVAGRFAGLDEQGGLRIIVDRQTRTLALADALRRPSWRL